MKRSIFIIFLFSLFSNVIVSAADIPISPNPPIIPPPYPRTCKQNETIVSAILNDTEVVLNFNTSVGLTTITVSNYLGSIVYQQTIDTYSTSELDIPIDCLDNGNYSITIQYNDVILSCDFAF